MTRPLDNPMSCRDALALAAAAIQARAAERRAQYRALRADGATVTAAAEEVGISRSTAIVYERAVCAGLPRNPTPAEGRREDYAELRDRGLSIAEAAARLAVTRRTADRYEAARRQLAGASR